MEKNFSYFIYGAGKTGRKFAEALRRSGRSKIVFIDREKKDENIDGISVCDLDYLSNYVGKDDAIIFVSLNNGFENERIAYEIYTKFNLDRIIFLPMNLCMNEAEKSLMRKIFFLLSTGNADKIMDECFPKISCLKKFDGCRVIEQYDGYISLWININRINFRMGEFGGVYRAYSDIYLYCVGNNDIDLTDYYRFQKGMGRRGNLDEMIEDRKILFTLFQSELKFGTSFFESSPCPVEYDEKANKLYLLEGMHRMVFLKENGFTNIPVVMTVEEFERMSKKEVI